MLNILTPTYIQSVNNNSLTFLKYFLLVCKRSSNHYNSIIRILNFQLLLPLTTTQQLGLHLRKMQLFECTLMSPCVVIVTSAVTTYIQSTRNGQIYQETFDSNMPFCLLHVISWFEFESTVFFISFRCKATRLFDYR